jgi:hypothetical protein
VAYRYTATRLGGAQATVIDTWQEASQTEIWLIIAAPSNVTTTIVDSLKG